MRVIGLDVCKNSVNACLLTAKPDDPREFYYQYEFHKIYADSVGIATLLSLKPDVAILEPTGMNYSKLWVETLSRAGVEVRYVDHKKLRNYRQIQLALPDKDDDADSLALACYYFDYGQIHSRFVWMRDPTISKIKELMLRLHHLTKVKSPIINRLRQDLAWQFPEVMGVKSVTSGDAEVPLLWGWMAGERESEKYDRLYKETIGLGLNNNSRFHARRLCDIERETNLIEEELQGLLASEKFAKYREVFEQFRFGDRVQANILCQIFPIQRFYGEGGKPEVKILKGRNSRKPTTRYLSLRRFQKALGMAPSQESSGDKSKAKVISGSEICRKSLWQWVFSTLEPVKCSKRTTPILERLGEVIDTEKTSGRPVQLVRNRVAARAAKILFEELVKTLQN
jgi:hypothetical protein